ncbi:MAG: hypothetical protein KME52_06970 [Desmonostoc geniculatum HA4340-LM1]|nr:hypothetical protein [Desmonostoc geniculatum HA4340-LM1]
MDFCRSSSNFNCKRSLLVGAFVSYELSKNGVSLMESQDKAGDTIEQS